MLLDSCLSRGHFPQLASVIQSCTLLSWERYHGISLLDVRTALVGNIWLNQSCY